MVSKIMQVFYGDDCLPYKDHDRSIHYPIVGSSFNGSSNTTTIRFYVDRIGGVDSVTWVAISKLPNGQIGNEVLNSNNAIYDEELGEHYIEISLSSYYTTIKGDIYISLNGYQGGVEIEQDEDTGIYSIYGTPTIQATGCIKIAINYAPQTIPGTHFNTSDLQQVLGLISDKANINDVFIVLDNISTSDLSGYNDGQLFYDKTTKNYYVKDSENDPNYYIYSFVLNYKDNLQSGDILDTLYTSFGNRYFAFKYGTNFGICKIGYTTLFNWNVVAYYFTNDGNVNYYNKTGVYHDTTLASILGGTPNHTFATQEYVESNYAKPSDLVYTRGNYLVVDISTTTIGDIYSNVDTSETFRIGGSQILLRGTYLLEKGSNVGSNYNFKITCIEHNSVDMIGRYWETTLLGVAPTTTLITIFNNLLNTPATTKYVDEEIASFKENEITVVNITTYPTLNDFLASTGTEGYIYLYPIDTSDLTKGYYRYVWENNTWLALGTTEIDLSDYYTKAETNTILGDYATTTYVSSTYTPLSRTIAGISLSSDISSQALTDALVLTNTTTDVDYILGE